MVQEASKRKSIFILDEQRICFLLGVAAVFLAQFSQRTGSNYYMYAAYFMIVGWCLICKLDLLFPVALFLLVDNNILEIGGVSVQLSIMMIYLCRSLFIYHEKLHRMTIVFAALITFYSLIYYNLGFTYVLYGLRLAIVIVFYTEFLCIKSNGIKEAYDRMLGFAVWGLFFSFFIALLVNRQILEQSRLSISVGGAWNLVGVLAAVLFTHSLMMYFSYEKMNYLLYTGITLVISIMSTSRTALLVLVISFIWIFLFAKKKSASSILKRLVIISVVTIVVYLIVSGTVQIGIVNKLMDRIVNPRRGDISNGRFTLWSQYTAFIFNDPTVLIFGYGSTGVKGLSTIATVPHNMYIEQLLMYGIVGNIIVFFLYYNAFKYSIREHKFNFGYKRLNMRYVLPILIIFVVGFFSHVLTSVFVTSELFLGLIQMLVLSSENSPTVKKLA